MKSLPHHWMESTIEPLLLIAILIATVSEMLGTGNTEPLTGSADSNNDLLKARGEVCPVKYRADLLLCCLSLARGIRAPGVDIDDDTVLIREAVKKAGHVRNPIGEIGMRGERRHNDGVFALIIVGCFYECLPINCSAFEVL